MIDGADLTPLRRICNVVNRLKQTEALAKHVRLMMQFRAIRDFAKQERAKASDEDKVVWEHLYRVILESAVLTEQSIAGLLPSGSYHYQRDLPEP